MHLISRSVAASAAALVAVILCYGGVRALWGRPHQSTNQSVTSFTALERAEAERVCLQVQADGCSIWNEE
jgi:hypothetical protein